MKSLISGLLNKSPVSYTSRGGVSLPWTAKNDAAAQMAAYGSVSTLFAIVHRTSNATSSVNWRLWRRAIDGRRSTATGEPEQRTEVTRHAALDLLNGPNPFATRQEFIEGLQQHIDLTGEGWVVVVRDPRSPLPMELWGIRPDRMTPVPHPERFISGYVYSGPNGEKVPLGVDEVIQIKMPNPLDPYRGMGPVQAAMIDLDSARYSAEWNRNFFLNSAEPGGIVEFEKRLEDDEFTEFTERWREQHRGVQAAHRVAVIEQGHWVGNSMSMRDMQFEQLRNVSRDIIREAFGIHGHMLGNSVDVNKANAEAGEISFARWLVKPRCERIKQALNSKLLPMFGPSNVEFDHDRVVPEDREADDRERTSRAQAAQMLVSAGFAPDDVTRACGLPEMAFTGSVDTTGAESTDTAATARGVVEMIQKAYLGVGVVVTAEEVRELLNQAGASLSVTLPEGLGAAEPPAA